MSRCISFHFPYYGPISCDYAVSDILLVQAWSTGAAQPLPCSLTAINDLVIEYSPWRSLVNGNSIIIIKKKEKTMNRSCTLVYLRASANSQRRRHFRDRSPPQRELGYRSIPARRPRPPLRPGRGAASSVPRFSLWLRALLFIRADGIIIIIKE